ncbi:MAG TPA: SLBB domain-containing protein, partial [Armatimonadota bacterium]|nr:SLBB domain-containing protein [Armatimonadota bacterium]
MTQAQKIGVGVAILAILGAVALGIYGNSRTASPLENAEIYVEPAADAAPVKIYVHVTGAVRAPDVYELPVEARAWQAVQAAGGLLENADEASANLAAPLSDGARLEIPFRQPVVEPDRPIAVPLGPPVDVNRATAEQLKTLPG